MPIAPPSPTLPVLAVELARDATRALLRVPGHDDQSFVLPAEEHPPAPSDPGTPAFWHRLRARIGLPLSGLTLACADEPYAPDAPGPPLLYRLIEQAGSGGLPVEALARPCPFPDMLRLAAIQRMTGAAAADMSTASALGLLVLPDVRRRAFRQGVTLLHLDGQRIFAALLFRDALHAFCELSVPRLFPDLSAPDPDPLLRLLNDFRLGWLPPEQAAAVDGRVCRASEPPPEAEGFGPLIAAGPAAFLLEGRARVVEDGARMTACQGLLYGHCLAMARE